MYNIIYLFLLSATSNHIFVYDMLHYRILAQIFNNLSPQISSPKRHNLSNDFITSTPSSNIVAVSLSNEHFCANSLRICSLQLQIYKTLYGFSYVIYAVQILNLIFLLVSFFRHFPLYFTSIRMVLNVTALN
jgi:hypothetical protein